MNEKKFTASRTRSPRRRENAREPRELVMPVTADAIARRAYGLYLDRGRADGHDLDDWFAAERELTELTREHAANK